MCRSCPRPGLIPFSFPPHTYTASLKPHALTLGHTAHHKRPQAGLKGGVHLLRRHHRHHAHTHVERPEHLSIAHAAGRLQPLENFGGGPGAAINRAAEVGALGEDAGEVFGEAATGDVAQALWGWYAS